MDRIGVFCRDILSGFTTAGRNASDEVIQETTNKTRKVRTEGRLTDKKRPDANCTYLPAYVCVYPLHSG